MSNARTTPGGLAGAGEGERFYKMSGSGNDFVFFDARAGLPALAAAPGQIAAICARGTGVGADGVVFLDQPATGVIRIAYYNSDGSRADLCGNATLCTARLAVHLGAASSEVPFVIRTDVGDVRAQVGAAGPSFELAPVQRLTPDTDDFRAGAEDATELRIGHAVAGVPHVVVLVPDVDTVALGARAPALRVARPERPDGANVNFVSAAADGWRMRTFERGVEAETLACGTGAVACAAVLQAWGEARAGSDVRIITRSGRPVTVRIAQDTGRVTLAGEGRLVFEGYLRDWAG